MEIRFVFKSSSGKPRVHRKRLPVTIGRCASEEVRLRIPIDSVSRKHCEFFLDEGGTVCVRDLGSTNGTLLNGEPIDADAAVVVAPGSSVKVGTVVFRVEFNATKNDPDGDTVSVSEAFKPEPVDKAPTEPLEPQAVEDEELEMEDDSASEGTPAAGDFAFLGSAASESQDDGSDEGESESEEAAAPTDENLEDFFKGLK
jgi:pSer/pThr/pTyr-binding forkhead associated (FHA) protein